MGKSRIIAGLVGLSLVALLPLAGHWARQGREQACALDGVKIAPIYRVRIQDEQGQVHNFCCIRCAELWLKRQDDQPRKILVTDEQSGQEIAANQAHFVRSTVVNRTTIGNRIHVFKSRTDAENHVESFGGRILAAQEQPFGEYR